LDLTTCVDGLPIADIVYATIHRREEIDDLIAMAARSILARRVFSHLSRSFQCFFCFGNLRQWRVARSALQGMILEQARTASAPNFKKSGALADKCVSSQA
jgi:hypothetical protein